MNIAGFESYYKKNIENILNDLDTSEAGLSRKEAKNRLLRDGPNKLPEPKTDNVAKLFLRQFQSPLIFILLVAAAIVFLTGEKIDSIVILFVLFFNAIVGTVQEGKAQNIFLALRDFVKTDAVVVRDGVEYIIPDEEIVEGDIIVVREGEKIPADARLLHSDSLQVEEAALTGESTPKFKFAYLKKRKNNSEFAGHNMVFKGTGVTAGSGRAVVVATGADTFIGGIAKKMNGLDEELPLKGNIRRFSRFIILVVLAVSFLIFVIGLMRGYSFGEIFSTIVAISVSMIPEGLPIVVTLVLATGVWRMGKKNVLVKRLQAVEALGQIDVIAVDKTGTVTKNELIVKEVYVNSKVFSVGGSGYEPRGEIKLEGRVVDPLNHSELLVIGKIATLCNNSSLAFDNNLDKWKVSGDPTEAAILVFAEKIGFRKDSLESEFKKIAEQPFKYILKYHASLYRQKEKNVLFVIGAPEEILKSSERFWHGSKFLSLSLKEKNNLKKVFVDMSKRGLRIVALGMKTVGENSEIPDKLSSLDFVGFFGIEDSLREEVYRAVSRVKSAGIKLVMITGDHEITAKAIAEKSGIFRGGKVMNGDEIDELTDEELVAQLEGVNVFSRVLPAHKLKIINAYKLSGKTIAMTGDGVNDAMSLAAADVGVAMGKIGTEVAKEASDIILLDDNFGSIVSGIEEGRNINKTIKRVILYLFSTNIGEALTIIIAILLGFLLPILAVQILWLNLVTDGFFDMALAMEPESGNFLEKKFTKKESGFIDKTMILRMFIMAFPMVIGTLFLFGRNYPFDLPKAWTMSLTTLAVFQWFNSWNCRSVSKSIFHLNPFTNRFLIGATIIVVAFQFLAIYNHFFQSFLHTVPLSGKDWLAIIPIAFSIVIIEEIRKFFYRRKMKK